MIFGVNYRVLTYKWIGIMQRVCHPAWSPFERGVTILGGVKIMDAAKIMQVVSEGAEPQPSN